MALFHRAERKNKNAWFLEVSRKIREQADAGGPQNTTLARLQREDETLTRVKVTKKKQEEFVPLCDAIASNEHVTHVTLKGPAAGEHVVRVLRDTPRLFSASITVLQWTAQQVQDIATALRTTHASHVHLFFGNQRGDGLSGAMSVPLCEALRNNDQLLSLNLHHVRFCDPVALGERNPLEVLADSLSHNDTLTGLDLQRCRIQGNIAPLPRLLNASSTLVSLDLAECELGDEGTVAMCDALHDNTTLKSINITRNGVRRKAFEAVGRMLECNSCLESFDISANPYPGVAGMQWLGLTIVCRALEQNTSLKKLCLRHLRLDDLGMQPLTKLLKRNHTLDALDVSQNLLKDAGTVALMSGLSHNKGITCLDVSHNKVGVAGANAIADFLQRDERILELSLGGGHGSSAAAFHGEGLEKLVAALKHNRTLMSLRMQRVSTCDEDAKQLSDAVRCNSTVAYLHLENNNFSDAAMRQFAEALSENTSLRKLTFSGHVLKAEGLATWASVLKGHSGLEELHLQTSPIARSSDADATRSMMEALAEQQSLVSLTMDCNYETSVELQGYMARNKALVKHRWMEGLHQACLACADDSLPDVLSKLILDFTTVL